MSSPPPSPEYRDISRPLTVGLAGWPGDVPYSFHLGWKMSTGGTVNLGAITTSVHIGTHVDSPFHYDPHGATVEKVPLDVFIGLAMVVDVVGKSSWKDSITEIEPRMLFRTGGWPDSATFPERIPVMEPDLPDWLADRGVKLIGVDLPSVDALDSKTLDRHHALGRRGIHILEGLLLNGVAGRYELIALPLPIVGGDGSPVRAVLKAMARG